MSEHSDVSPGGSNEEGGDPPLHAVRMSRVSLAVGSTPVYVLVHDTGVPGLTYVNVHNDERTAVDAGLTVIGRHGGRVLELSHDGARNITFEMGGETYVFDPNRMFTDAGARKSLAELGPYSDAAHRVVRAFAEEAFASFGLAPGGAVITLHNTMSGLFSARSYMDAGEYAPDVVDVALPNDGDPFDFVFVTDPGIHEALAQAGINSVLQDNERTRDDGSLSIRAVPERLLYANVEARLGHLESQIGMLLTVRSLFEERLEP